MVQWEKQIEERSVPEWRDKYVAYARLKRKLEQIKAAASVCRTGSEDFIPHAITRAAMESDYDESRRVSKESDTEAPLLHREETVRQKQEEFLHAVKEELVRVGHWYKDQVTALEAEVRRLSGEDGPGVGDAALTNLANQGPADIEKLHLKAVRLTEFVLLNVEALRKIVKKMDKQCGTSWQKVFVERDLKDSPLATNSAQPFNGERARACRRALEELVSPERLQEMRSRAMESGGVGLSTMPWSWRRTLVAVALAGAALKWSAFRLPDEPKCQRCLGLMIFTMLMWVLEAAPFEATAMLVAPLAVWLDVMEGDRHEQAKLLLAAVFNDSLYLVLSGFVMSSIFSKCQLELRAAALLQSWLGRRPKCFMLAIMILGVFLSALLSNVTAPLLMVEVLKPLIRDLPTDSRYSRALLLGLAFSCNVGGMMTPISSPQNVASLEALRQHGKNITWGEWLCLSVPFCFLAVVMAWLILLLVYQFDVSADEAARSARKGDSSSRGIPPVVFDREDMSYEKLLLFVGAIVTLVAFASAQAAATFGGTSSIALLFVAICMGTGGISRQTFNSYSWHLLFLIGGGSALGLAVRQSGLLKLVTEVVRSGLSSSPWQLVAELMLVLVGATTFVSHTVAALVLMPLVVELGEDAGVERLAVLLGAFACSAACALPMTSFPNVNSLIAVDDRGKPWLSVKHFLMAGIPTTLALTLLLISAGYKLGVWVLS